MEAVAEVPRNICVLVTRAKPDLRRDMMCREIENSFAIVLINIHSPELCTVSLWTHYYSDILGSLQPSLCSLVLIASVYCWYFNPFKAIFLT